MIDDSLVRILPPGSVKVIHTRPAVCMGINRIPIRSAGEVLITFSMGCPAKTFRARFSIIENLIHPIVLGLPFMREQRAILSFENDTIYFGDCSIPIRQSAPPKKPPPLHVAAYESVTLPPWSRSRVQVYLTGTGLKRHEQDTVQNLYVRPFTQETDMDLPQVAAHTIIDTSQPTCVIEVLNIWPNPINVHKDMPLGLVDTINPEIVPLSSLEAWPSASAESGQKESSVNPAMSETQENAGFEEMPPEKLVQFLGHTESKPTQKVRPSKPQDSLQPHFTTPYTDTPPPTPVHNHATFGDKEMPPEKLVQFLGHTERMPTQKVHPFDTSHTHPVYTPPFTDSPTPSIRLNQGWVKMEEMDDFPMDEPTPCNNSSDLTGDCVLEDLSSLFAVVEEQDEVPPLIDVTDEEDEERNVPDDSFKVNTEGIVFTGENLAKFHDLCERYKEIFATSEGDIGGTDLLYHEIKLTTDRPIAVPNYRAPPPDVQRQINSETDKLLAAGVIELSDSPFNAPIVLVRKPRGGWRYCTDFRKLNKHTEKAHFPLPGITDGLRRFKSPKVFSGLDLIKGYYNISILPSQRRLFAFSDGRRHLQYIRMPMGARNSASTMQMLVELVFRGLPIEYTLAYLDDLIVATPDEESHLVMLERVFAALSRAKLKVHPHKCTFANASLSALGFILDAEGIRPDPKNLAKIAEWPYPTNVSEVRGYLGLCGYYRGHVPKYAAIAEPLTDLLKKDTPFEFGPLEKAAFDNLKEELLKGSATAYPDFDRVFIVKPDGSATTVGALLTQKDPRGKEVMIAAASQKLNSTERAWAPYDRELYGVVWAVRQFSNYVRYKPFEIITDHKPLLSCINVDASKDATGKRTRWALELGTYDYVIKHKPGRKHTDADALSRAPHADEARPEEEEENLFVLGAMTYGEVPLSEMESDDDVSAKVTCAQRQDEDIGKVIDVLTNDKANHKRHKLDDMKLRWYSKHFDSLRVIDGRLYSIKKINQDDVARLVIPKSMIAEVINRSHGDYKSGHPGIRRTLDRLNRFCVWPTMAKDVENKIKTCHECQAYGPKHVKEVPVVPITYPDFPMHHVITDLLKMGKPSDGYEYVLVIADHYTRYVVLYPVRNKEAITIAKRLESFVTRFGYPVAWGSDNGSEFRNNLSQAICKLYETKKEFSMSYHPQTQGVVERFNRTIIQEVSKRIEKFGPRWSQFLPWIEYGYNTSQHPGTHHTPYALMFGREARIPTSTMLPPQPISTQGWKNNDRKYFGDVQKRMTEWRDIRSEYMDRYHSTRYNTNKKIERPYRPGDSVLVVRPKEKRTKLSLHYDGPYDVIKRVGGDDGDGNVYVLKDDKAEELIKPAVDLKRYLPPVYEGDETDRLIDYDLEDVLRDDQADDMIPKHQKLWTDGLIPHDEFVQFYGDDSMEDVYNEEAVRRSRRIFRRNPPGVEAEEGLPTTHPTIPASLVTTQSSPVPIRSSQRTLPNLLHADTPSQRADQSLPSLPTHQSTPLRPDSSRPSTSRVARLSLSPRGAEGGIVDESMPHSLYDSDAETVAAVNDSLERREFQRLPHLQPSQQTTRELRRLASYNEPGLSESVSVRTSRRLRQREGGKTQEKPKWR